LRENDVKLARRWIHDAELVVVFSGAGLSTESGIPTFRDASTGGFWAKYDPMKLASPQGFAADRRLVTEWYAYRVGKVARAEPNPAHIAIAQYDLRHPGKIINITQNVDALLQKAGAKQVYELHGTLMEDRCNSPFCDYRRKARIYEPNEEVSLDDCPRCGSPLRPAVVWFGETLPEQAWQASEKACRMCDVILAVGTSGVVYPAAGLVETAKYHEAKVVVVNPQQSELDYLADVIITATASRGIPALLDGD